MGPGEKRRGRGCEHLGAVREQQARLHASLLHHWQQRKVGRWSQGWSRGARCSTSVVDRPHPPADARMGGRRPRRRRRLQAAGQPLLPLGDGLLCLGCGARCASPLEHGSNGGAGQGGCTGGRAASPACKRAWRHLPPQHRAPPPAPQCLPTRCLPACACLCCGPVCGYCCCRWGGG